MTNTLKNRISRLEVAIEVVEQRTFTNIERAARIAAIFNLAKRHDADEMLIGRSRRINTLLKKARKRISVIDNNNVTGERRTQHDSK